MSPRRWAGWEPTTTHLYDDQGRMVSSTPEPEWDDWDTALVDAYVDWSAGVHSCGHHQDVPDEYIAGYTVCRACEALQKAQQRQADLDKPQVKQGNNPDFPRRWRVDALTPDQVAARVEAVPQKSALQLMNEAVAKRREAGSGDHGQ